MPSRKLADGTYKDIAHPINNEFRQTIEKMILDKYRKVVENPELQGTPDPFVE
jgi:stage V sporulation protein G